MTPRLINKGKEAKHRVERRVPDLVVELIDQFQQARAPARPSRSVIAGPHIIVCSNMSAIQQNSNSTGLTSVTKLTYFLRPLRAEHPHAPIPVIVVDPHAFTAEEWVPVGSEFDHVRLDRMSSIV